MTAAVLLAAGAGSRFDGRTHKLLAPLDGAPVVARSATRAVESGLDVIVVVGAVDLTAHLPAAVTVVENPQWADGQAVSVRAGLTVAEALGHDAAVIGLADQPGVTADAWRAVAGSRSPIAVATYDGVRANPVRLDRTVWALLPPVGDEVGRAVMRAHPDLVEEVPCAGVPDDIDTMEDLRRWS